MTMNPRAHTPANDLKPGARCRSKEVTGRMVFICFVAFFAVVAGVNAIMIRAAVSTFSGVETENAYQAGLAFEREMAAVEAQDALHWQVSAKVSADAGATLIAIIASDAAGQPLMALQATGHLIHPTDRRFDREVPLGEDTPGQFKGRTDAAAGQWTLVIELSREGTRLFRSRNRVFVR
jgi:nitrogen fixation protein FixH